MKYAPFLLFAIFLTACSSSLAAAASPSSADPSVGAVIDRLQLVGVPIGDIAPISSEDIRLPRLAPSEVLAFEIPLDNGYGGRVYMFPDVPSMEIAMDALQGRPAIGDPPAWLFPYGKVLLELDGRVPKEWATQYRDALYSLAWSAE
jgi:hypothetical protein